MSGRDIVSTAMRLAREHVTNAAAQTERKPRRAHNRKPDHQRHEAAQLYLSGMTIKESAAAIGMPWGTVAKWLKEAGCTRKMGDAFAMAVQKGRKKRARSKNIPWQSTKTGRWEFADSTWEAVRMQQLDDDPSVVGWTRLVERVPYVAPDGRSRFYAPDFEIQYASGDVVVEEVKPSTDVNHPSVIAKANAAREQCEKSGKRYRIVTEFDIGVPDISRFRLGGLHEISEEQKRAAYRKRKRDRARVLAKREADAAGIAWPPDKHRHPLSVRNRAVELYLQGYTGAEVGPMLGVSPTNVRNWLHERGIPRRKATTRPKHERPGRGVDSNATRQRSRVGSSRENRSEAIGRACAGQQLCSREIQMELFGDLG